MTMQTIKLTHGNRVTGERTGERTVQAEVIGPFGIHEHPDDSSLHAITHIPTGFRVCGTRSAAQARVACKEYLAIKGVSWDFTDPDVVIAWPKAARERAGEIARKAIA